MLHETIELPWPPSVNMVYRSFAMLVFAKNPGRGVIRAQNGRLYRASSRMLISENGRKYFDSVAKLLKASKPLQFGKARLRVVVRVHAKDRRARDLGNLDKVLMDALEKAEVFTNDSQIDIQEFVRGQICPHKNARVVIELTEIQEGIGPPCDCHLCRDEMDGSLPLLFDER